jgi:hypothetical protein
MQVCEPLTSVSKQMPKTVLISSGARSSQRSSLHTTPMSSALHPRRLRAANTAHALPLAHISAPHVLIPVYRADRERDEVAHFRTRISCCSAPRRSTNGRAGGIPVSVVALRRRAAGACPVRPEFPRRAERCSRRRAARPQAAPARECAARACCASAKSVQGIAIDVISCPARISVGIPDKEATVLGIPTGRT